MTTTMKNDFSKVTVCTTKTFKQRPPVSKVRYNRVNLCSKMTNLPQKSVQNNQVFVNNRVCYNRVWLFKQFFHKIDKISHSAAVKGFPFVTTFSWSNPIFFGKNPALFIAPLNLRRQHLSSEINWCFFFFIFRTSFFIPWQKTVYLNHRTLQLYLSFSVFVW